MIEEENPYAPPKSSDFRLPENEKPSKWQVFRRILWLCAVFIPLITAIPFLIHEFLFKRSDFYEIMTTPFFMLFLYLFIFIIFSLPTTILLFIIECRIQDFKKKIIYSLLGGILLYFLLGYSIEMIIPLEEETFTEFVAGIFEIICYLIAICLIVFKLNHKPQ
ncbi:MAG: hypothetical protein IJM09_06975 [Neisseriaceae bacterium]|nr:hypothetical protein [Neisseriaceae bacterium]